MKDLLSRIEKLESKMLPPKPALILRIGQDEAKARQEYRANNGFPPDRFIQVVRATREH